jgi:PAS domain S-box-containing protein
MTRPLPAGERPRAAVDEVFVGGGDMGARMRAFDWLASPLGPVEQWPQSLRSAVSILLPSRAQIVLFWGPDLIALYNDAYRPVFAAKHPWALGKPARECWAEIWDVLGPLLDGVVQTGEAFWAKDHPFFLDRHGYIEETYFDVSYDPVRVEGGGVGGVFCIVSETTGRVIGERRLATLRELGARSGIARGTDAVLREAAGVLAANPRDLPFALLYAVDGAERARLVCASGVEAAAVREADGPLAEAVREVTSGAGSVLVPAGTFLAEPPLAAAEQALVLPITSGTQVAGILVAAVSRFLALPGDYADFLALVAARISTTVAGVLAHEEERRRAEQLAELDRAKTVFFSNVSHELRTPLTLLLGPLEDLLQSPALPSGERERLAMMHRNGVRLLKLVNALLDFSRIEAGRAEASYEPVDLAAYTAELTAVFRSAVERAGLALVVDCPPLPAPVWVDREMWEKIVLNLLSNALKFTFEGRIAVRLAPDGAGIRLDVADTGVGIAADDLPQLFQRFHRVRGARSRSHEGTGIGLAMVQELVRLHGGSIDVRSEPGSGTTFTVVVPAGAAHLPADRLRAPRALAPTGVGTAPFVEEALRWIDDGPAPDGAVVPATAAGGCVLVADDNGDMRAYLERLLSGRWTVVAVADGRAALQAAHARRPDLVLADVMMPGLDGFGLLAALRADPALADVPVILLSARAGEESRIEGLDAGADDYLVKPFSTRELVARVSAHLGLGAARRRALEQVRRRERELDDFFEHAMVPIHWVGRDGTILRANRAELALLGWSREEYVGRHVAELHVDQHVIAGMLQRLAAGEDVEDLPARLRARDGSIKHVLISGNVLWEEGRFVHTRCITRDVTDLHRAEEERRRLLSRERAARAEAEAASRAKDDFLAMLAHELRNPLGVIATGIDVLNRTGSPAPEAVRVRALIARQSRHLARLLDDLLDVARITQDKIDLRLEDLDLRGVVDSALQVERGRLEAHGLTLQILVPDHPVVVTGDPVRLQQVVANLLNNAAKYTGGGGAIDVALATADRQAILTVRDNGIGIPGDKLEAIFDLFVQVDTGLVRAQGGLGIGLTLVKRLVEQHGGAVEARSAGPDQGSEFVVRLPLTLAPVASPPAAGPRRGGASREILLIEDNEDAREALRLGLELDGHRVRVAASGPDGVAQARLRAPDVAIVDLGLPGLDGYEVARVLRREFGPALRLIALTGYGQPADRQRALAAGFDAHLTKPANIDELIGLVAA